MGTGNIKLLSVHLWRSGLLCDDCVENQEWGGGMMLLVVNSLLDGVFASIVVKSIVQNDIQVRRVMSAKSVS